MAGVVMENGLDDVSFWDFKGQADYVDSWFLMGKPYTVLWILFFYLLFVLRCGPAFMRDRQPYKLRNVLLAYNAVQVLMSMFLVSVGMKYIFRYGIFHKTCLFDHEEIRKEILSDCYWYVIAKMTELLDTVFFVLRKKQNQVSFLHVYHHTFVLVMSYLLVKYGKTDDLLFVGTLNSFVHIWMYGYYALSVFPEISRFLWWKKYLTSMQLVQFVLDLAQFIVNTIVSSCPPSKLLMGLTVLTGFSFLYLFTNFYRNSYGNRKKSMTQKIDSNDVTKKLGVSSSAIIRNKLLTKGLNSLRS